MKFVRASAVNKVAILGRIPKRYYRPAEARTERYRGIVEYLPKKYFKRHKTCNKVYRLFSYNGGNNEVKR